MSYKVVNGKIVKEQRDFVSVAKRKFFRKHRPVIKRDNGMFHNISYSYFNTVGNDENYIRNELVHILIDE